MSTLATLWPVEPQLARIQEGRRKCEFDLLYTQPLSIGWAGQHRIMVHVGLVLGDLADSLGDVMGPSARFLTFYKTDFVQVDVEPAIDSVRRILDPARDANGDLWKQYVQVLRGYVDPVLPQVPSQAGLPEWVVQKGLDAGLPLLLSPLSTEFLNVSSGIGAEYRLLALIHAAQFAVRQSRQGGDPAPHLERAAEFLSLAASCGAAEERSAAAIVMHARVREIIGPPEMVGVLKASVSGEVLVSRMRRYAWFNAEVRRYLGVL